MKRPPARSASRAGKSSSTVRAVRKPRPPRLTPRIGTPRPPRAAGGRGPAGPPPRRASEGGGAAPPRDREGPPRAGGWGLATPGARPRGEGPRRFLLEERVQVARFAPGEQPLDDAASL